MMDYDIRSRAGRRRGRAHPGHREPDGLPAASRGLGRGARDGAPRRRPAADGRAVRPRGPRHPAHRHPCLPTLTCPGSSTLPHTWRPFGVRIAGVVFGGALLVVCAFAWFSFDPETRAKFTGFQRGTLVFLGPAGVRRLVRPGALAGGRRAGQAGGRQRLPPPRATTGPRSSRCTCRRAHRGSPSTSATARPCRRSASRAPTGRGRTPRCASCARWSTAEPTRPGLSRGRGRPTTRSARRPPHPDGASVTRSSPERNASGGRGHRLHRQGPAGRAGHLVGAEDLQPPVPLVDPQRPRRGRRRVAQHRGGDALLVALEVGEGVVERRVAHRPRHPEVVRRVLDVLAARPAAAGRRPVPGWRPAGSAPGCRPGPGPRRGRGARRWRTARPWPPGWWPSG